MKVFATSQAHRTKMTPITVDLIIPIPAEAPILPSVPGSRTLIMMNTPAKRISMVATIGVNYKKKKKKTHTRPGPLCSYFSPPPLVGKNTRKSRQGDGADKYYDEQY